MGQDLLLSRNKTTTINMDEQNFFDRGERQGFCALPLRPTYLSGRARTCEEMVVLVWIPGLGVFSGETIPQGV